ncbi:MAG: BMP family ABC transporter substrate-binding protein [Oscillospiraceae bacterium]|nr:BMP family ABC transporter substrate-binding protein [Oscillospiraceae bacterium]
MISTHAELLESYRQARRSGRRYVSEKRGQSESGFLPLLEEGRLEFAQEITLGLMEIPLKKIRGTYSAGRQTALAGNFMPLLEEDSEFAGKWRGVLAAHLDEGLREPVQVYEYLGWYYVREGNKRVSVLHFMDAYGYAAHVTRLLPPADSPEEAVKVFYELAGPDRRRPIRHLWFSRFGTYTELFGLAGKAVSSQAPASGAETKNAAETLLRESFQRFRRAYHASGYTDLPLTTGDAFAGYVRLYGFPLETPEKELMLNIRNCGPLYASPDGAAQTVLSDPEDMASRARLSSLLPKSNRLTAAFVCAGTPRGFWPAAHAAGRLRLEREYPQMKIRQYYTQYDASDAYAVLSKAVAEAKPDILFAADARMEPAALRVALERRGTPVLLCAAGAGHKVLSTYYGNTGEAAFLCGAAAGALSESGRLGYIPGRYVTGALPQDMQAFAQGACMVRPGARVLQIPLTAYTARARLEVFAALAEAGCDIAWFPVLLGEPLEYKTFPGVYAQLCTLRPDGRPYRRVAVAAWHWEEFYASLMQKLTQDGPDLSGRPAEFPLHFRMGVGTGLVDAHLIYPVASPFLPRLLDSFRDLLGRGKINAADEEMAVEIEEGSLGT